MRFLTDRKRAAGLGSAGDGVHHWWQQRVTAVALVPLALLFLFPFARALGSGHEAVLAAYGKPFNAIVAIAFFAAAFAHLRLGLQEVIVDYVSSHGMRAALLVVNTLACWLLGLAGIFAVVLIAL
ncbi:MAG: succinate dehydrogenase, hydrophobic membrane anchor protein [Rhodobacteraceae bacterium]|nr:succinate dehydrogenase, hydrophobic membrane anchor protein [Paracoccaceae bacterium]